MHDLGVLPGALLSEAFGINDAGDIVGSSGSFIYPNGIETSAAVLWRSGIPVDLNILIPPTSSVILANAMAINARGEIVANGWDDGPQHAFLLVPK